MAATIIYPQTVSCSTLMWMVKWLPDKLSWQVEEVTQTNDDWRIKNEKKKILHTLMPTIV